MEMFDGVGDEQSVDVIETEVKSLMPREMMPAQQVRMGGYVTAIAPQQPRSLKLVQRRFIEECELMGEGAFYAWGTGNDHIEGPSVDLALAAARCYGNCAVDQQPVQETLTSYIFVAVFIDLETGFTLSRPFRQSKKWVVYGKMDEERKADVRFQIGASKATRNVVLNALPAWLIDQGIEAAKAGVRNKIEGYIKRHSVEAARQLAIGELKKQGVSEASVLAKFDYAAVTALTVDDLVRLRGDLKAIQTGQEAASALFPAVEAQATKPSQAERMAEKLAMAESKASESAPTMSVPAAPSADPEHGVEADAASPADPSTIPEPEPPSGEFATAQQVQELLDDAQGAGARTLQDIQQILQAYRNPESPVDAPRYRLSQTVYQTCRQSLDRQRPRRSRPANTPEQGTLN